MPPISVAGVGDNCIDRYLALGKSTVGGNAVNVAVHLARLGLGAAYFGAVGDDPDGRRVLAALGDNGVATGRVHVRRGLTAYTDIAFGEGGERIIAFEEFGVCAGYRPTDAEIAMLRRFATSTSAGSTTAARSKRRWRPPARAFRRTCRSPPLPLAGGPRDWPSPSPLPGRPSRRGRPSPPGSSLTAPFSPW